MEAILQVWKSSIKNYERGCEAIAKPEEKERCQVSFLSLQSRLVIARDEKLLGSTAFFSAQKTPLAWSRGRCPRKTCNTESKSFPSLIVKCGVSSLWGLQAPTLRLFHGKRADGKCHFPLTRERKGVAS